MGRRPRAVGVHYSQDEMLRVIQEGLSRQAKRPNLFGYKPHPKQELFHRATTHSKLYIGGNRAGKTTCGVVEDIFWLIGRHPYRKVPEPPTRLRVVAVDFIKGVDQIVLPEFKRWIPPSFLKSGSWDASYQKEGHLLTLANGSTCEFMSGDQDLDKFSGTSRHAIHYDEEPPEYIYKECQARLIDTDGSSWLTMTPVEGMCVDEVTEVLTQRGWLKYNQVQPNEVIMTHQGWKKLQGIYVDPNYSGKLAVFQGISAHVTANHKWFTDDGLIETQNLRERQPIITVDDTYNETMPSIWIDEFWELVGLIIGDGTLPNDSATKVVFYQNFNRYIGVCERFEELVEACDGYYTEGKGASSGNIRYTIPGNLGREIRRVLMPGKLIDYGLISILPRSSLVALIKGLVQSDGTIRENGLQEITTVSTKHADLYSAICALAGYRVTTSNYPMRDKFCYKIRIWPTRENKSNWDYIKTIGTTDYSGTVWCPYSEAGTFLARRYGSIYLTGNSWVYDTLYLPGIGKPSKFAGPVGAVGDDITVIVVDMLENPYITPEAAERYLGTLTGDERNAREHGTFVQLGGLVFKEFATAIHVIKGNFVPPFDWEWYVSIDHGYNNPTAMLWHAVSPDDRVITFSEHYASEMTVKEHAAVYHARNVALGKLPDFTVGDPAMAQRNGVTGTSIFQEYADAGVFVVPAGAKDVATGVNRMAQYLKLRIDGKPSWQITDNCDALINEIQRLRWKTWASRKNQFENNPHENIHKKNDHACDSSRYFFTFLPDLTPEVFKPVREDLAPLGNNRGADTAGSWDEVLAARSQQFKDISQTNWTTYEGNDLIALEYD